MDAVFQTEQEQHPCRENKGTEQKDSHIIQMLCFPRAFLSFGINLTLKAIPAARTGKLTLKMLDQPPKRMRRPLIVGPNAAEMVAKTDKVLMTWFCF